MILVSEKKRKNAISFDDWRKRIIQSQYAYPENGFISKIHVNYQNDQFKERSNLGSKRIDEKTSSSNVIGNSAA